MNAFNAIAFTHQLESVGFRRNQAETLANGYQQAMLSHVTHEQLKAALDAQTLRICGILGAFMTLGFAAVTVAITLS